MKLNYLIARVFLAWTFLNFLDNFSNLNLFFRILAHCVKANVAMVTHAATKVINFEKSQFGAVFFSLLWTIVAAVGYILQTAISKN